MGKRTSYDSRRNAIVIPGLPLSDATQRSVRQLLEAARKGQQIAAYETTISGRNLFTVTLKLPKATRSMGNGNRVKNLGIFLAETTKNDAVRETCCRGGEFPFDYVVTLIGQMVKSWCSKSSEVNVA